MKNFNEFWSKERARRRKLWAARYKTIRKKHPSEEELKEKVFCANLNRDELMRLHTRHICACNPIISLEDQRLYSEERLRERLVELGVDTSKFHMEMTVTHDHDEAEETCLIFLEEAIVCIRKVIPIRKEHDTHYEVDPYYGLFMYYSPNKHYNSGLNNVLTYDVKRFAYLDTATLLMEMAADHDLRKKEIMYYHKRQRLDGMKAAVIDEIKFKLWDDDTLWSRLNAYHQKGFSERRMLKEVARPWLRASSESIGLVTEANPDKSWEHFDQNTFEMLRASIKEIDPSSQVSLDKKGGVKIVCQGYAYTIGVRENLRHPFGIMVFIRPLSDYPHLELQFNTICTEAVALYVREAGRFNQRLTDYLGKARKMYQQIHNIIKFTPWDDDILWSRLKACHQKGFSESRMLHEVARPWLRTSSESIGLVTRANRNKIWQRIDQDTCKKLRASIKEIDPNSRVSLKKGRVKIVCHGYTYTIEFRQCLFHPYNTKVFIRPLSDYPHLELQLDTICTKAVVLYVREAGAFNQSLTDYLGKARKMYQQIHNAVSDITDITLQTH